MPGPIPLTDDLKELIELFQSHHVEFIVVGAHALAFHGRPRFTEDLDLFIRRTTSNVAAIALALAEFGIPLARSAEAELLQNPRSMIVLGRKPHQVDILNFLDGVQFEDAWSRAEAGSLATLSVRFLSLIDYVATKRASGRSKDIDDLNRLRELIGPEISKNDPD